MPSSFFAIFLVLIDADCELYFLMDYLFCGGLQRVQVGMEREMFFLSLQKKKLRLLPKIYKFFMNLPLAEKVLDLGNHFIVIIVKADLCSNSKNAKSREKFWWGTRCLHGLKCLTADCLLVARENMRYTLEKLDLIKQKFGRTKLTLPGTVILSTAVWRVQKFLSPKNQYKTRQKLLNTTITVLWKWTKSKQQTQKHLFMLELWIRTVEICTVLTWGCSHLSQMSALSVTNSFTREGLARKPAALMPKGWKA